MARIRTIKPEFPQSESMGNVSRDARLLFIMLWPICDDHGRTRAASRMLASLLYPYDDGERGRPKTTADDIDGWLTELEHEGCLKRYQADGGTYLQVCNWLKHQRIDKPSKPQFPEYSQNTREDSRGFKEPSPLEGKGREGKGEEKEAAGAAVQIDPDKAMWDAGKALLGQSAASLLGKMVKAHGREAVMGAIAATTAARPPDPKAYFCGVLTKHDDDDTIESRMRRAL